MIPSIHRKVWLAVAWSALSGVLLTAGFPKLNLPLFSWVALIPLFIALRDTNGKEAFRLGYICGLAHFLSLLYWIQYVVGHYGGLPAPLAIVVLFLLCAYLALYIGVFALLSQRWAPYPRLWIWGLPTVWVTLEWIRAHALTGFPWANLGYSQTPFIALIQIADLTGVWSISWLVVFANTCLMGFLNRYLNRTGIVFLGCCLIGVIGYGNWRIDTVENIQNQAEPRTVGVIQGNIDQSLKWDPAYQQTTLDHYRELTLKATQHSPAPQLLVWPETAVPFFYGIDEPLTKQVQKIVREAGVSLLFGSPGAEWAGGHPLLLNKAYLVNGDAEPLGQYAKQHLVPFGEYVPLQNLLFFVHRLVEAAGNFVPGRDPSPLRLDRQGLGVLICYEAIFPNLARRTVNLGATSLVNITNDAWFGTSSAPYQHLDMTRWRAVEFRVPLIRAANTGISTIFDATGRECGILSLNQPGFLVCTVRPVHLRTVYARWGDWFAWFCVLITLGCIVYSVRRSLVRR